MALCALCGCHSEDATGTLSSAGVDNQLLSMLMSGIRVHLRVHCGQRISSAFWVSVCCTHSRELGALKNGEHNYSLKPLRYCSE